MTEGVARKGWDLDLADGLAREGALGRLLGDAKVEVKSQVECRTHVFIEYECFGKPSGIATTEAQHWAIEYAPDTWIVVPTPALRELARAAYKRYGATAGGDGNNATGAVVPLAWLVNKLAD